MYAPRAAVSRCTRRRCARQRRPAMLCCARGHDNSTEKPRNICSAAINSETAPQFLANLHKTVTIPHSIIRPIRLCRPCTLSLSLSLLLLPLTSPASPPPLPHCFYPCSSTPSLVPVLSLPARRARWLGPCFICRFFSALHFPQFPTNPPDVTGMRARKASAPFAIVLQRYDVANNTLPPASGHTVIYSVRVRISFHYSFSMFSFASALP